MNKRIVNQESLRQMVENAVTVGRVIVSKNLAVLMGVHDATIGRNLRKIGIPVPGKKYEGSVDEEPRSHKEIARLIKEVVSRENPTNPLSDIGLVRLIGLKCSRHMVSKIRIKYGIPNSFQRRI